MPTPAKHLDVLVNGSAMELPEGATIADLLRYLELESLLVAVELNLEIVPKAEYSLRKLSGGDRIEVVHFVGGG